MLPLRTRVDEMYTNKDDSQIIWKITADSRKVMKIQRNIAAYDIFIQKVMRHKLTRKALNKIHTQDEIAELDSLLKDHTKISYVRTSYVRTADENTPEKKPGLWKRIKEKVKRE